MEPTQSEIPHKNETPRDKPSKTSSQKRKTEVLREESGTPSVGLRKTCMIKSGLDCPSLAKIRKHVTFEECANNISTERDQDSISSVPSETEVNTSSQSAVLVEQDAYIKAGPSNEIDISENRPTQDQMAALQARRFDPVRGHRPGKRPMYRGNADWSKEFDPVKEVKSPRSFFTLSNGLKRRIGSDSLSATNEEGKISANKVLSKCSVSSVEMASIVSPESDARTPTIQPGSVSATAVIMPLAQITSDVNSPAVAVVASTSITHMVTDSETADVGPAQESSEPPSVSEHKEPTTNMADTDISSTTAKAQTASALAQKLRDAFVSCVTEPEKRHVLHKPSSPPGSSVDKSKTDVSVATLNPDPPAPVQRIIVKDCSSSLSSQGNAGHQGISITPRVQTVIVKKLSARRNSTNHINSATSSSCNSPQMASLQCSSLTPDQLADRTTDPGIKPSSHSNSSPPLLNKIMENTSAISGTSRDVCKPSVKISGNLFENVTDLIDPPVLERVGPAISACNSDISVITLHNAGSDLRSSGSLSADQNEKAGGNGRAEGEGHTSVLSNGLSCASSSSTSFSHGQCSLRQATSSTEKSAEGLLSGQSLSLIRLVTDLPHKNTDHFTGRDGQQQDHQDRAGQEQDSPGPLGSPVGDYQPLLFDHPYCQGYRVSGGTCSESLTPHSPLEQGKC